MILVPKNWEGFQHYKDRRPTWIKLHRELLHDTQFIRLPAIARALAPMLWLLACEGDNGEFDGDSQELSFRLRLPEPEIREALESLVAAGYFVAAQSPEHRDRAALETTDSEPLPADSMPRREREEVEKEKESEKTTPAVTPQAKSKRPSPPEKVSCPEDVPPDLWSEWMDVRKRKTRGAYITPTAWGSFCKQAEAAGLSVAKAIAECVERQWVTLKAEWMKSSSNGRAGPRDHVTQRTTTTEFGGISDL